MTVLVRGDVIPRKAAQRILVRDLGVDAFMSPDERNADTRDSRIPHPIKKKIPRALAGTNLIGHEVGRLTVYGWAGKGRWAAQCSCGMFVLRTTRAVRNPENAYDRCDRCRAAYNAKRRMQEDEKA